MMILFGGGDGGGIVIDANGIHRIPPYDPGVLLQLKAVSALVGVNALHDATLTRDAAAIAERLTTSVIPQLTKTAGATRRPSKMTPTTRLVLIRIPTSMPLVEKGVCLLVRLSAACMGYVAASA